MLPITAVCIYLCLAKILKQAKAGGRKCEFGPAREPELQRLDLSNGWNQLLRQFGPRLDPIFTPPWNRCAAETPHVLAGLGYAALSRSRGATAQQVLPELPVDIDWSRQYREGFAPPRVAR